MIYSIFSGDELKILRKPDHDGFVMVRRVRDGMTRYVRLTELRETMNGELLKALDEAPPWFR